jgi:hypothetical protein
MGELIGFRWQLDDDGGGTVVVFTDRRSHVDETVDHFESLEQLPGWMADTIRDDGRLSGEFPQKVKT